MKPKFVIAVIMLLSFLGIVDSLYLTYEHYQNSLPPCTTGFTLVDCGVVLKSKYSEILGIPLSLFGFTYYATILMLVIFLIIGGKRVYKIGLLLTSIVGFVTSIYLMYLQLIVIGSICIFCTFSAVSSTIIFLLVQKYFPIERKIVLMGFTHIGYKLFLKPILFQLDPELVHNKFVSIGNNLGNSEIGKKYSTIFMTFKANY
jgi:uncharacterized membrane protein